MTDNQKQVEAWVLSALLEGDAGPTAKTTAELIAASGLKANHFETKEPRLCFESIEKCLAANIEPTVKNIITQASEGLGNLTLQKLLHLKNSNDLTFEGFMTQAQELKRRAQVRGVKALLDKEPINLQTKTEELSTRLEKAQNIIAESVQPDEDGTVDLLELMEEWSDNITNNRTGFIPTGVEVLDGVINGFVPNLNVIGGLPSVGKSALVAEIVYNVLSRGIPCGFFGLEDATAWISKRHLARQLKLKVWEIGHRRLNQHQMEETQVIAGVMAEHLKLLTVYRRAGITADELVARAKSWIVTRGVKCIFIDHGGEVNHGTNVRDRYDLAVANTYRALRDLAINYKVPIVVLAHFNRATGDGMPTMRSFAESEYIARMARLALGLWRKADNPELLCTVLKLTEGRKGDTLQLKMDTEAALVSSKGGEVLSPEDLEVKHAS
jgi:replicative DNA helicase